MTFRPQRFLTDNGYSYSPTLLDPTERLSLTDFSGNHRHPSDAHEVMSYDCKVPTFTAGATGSTVGSIRKAIDMRLWLRRQTQRAMATALPANVPVLPAVAHRIWLVTNTMKKRIAWGIAVLLLLVAFLLFWSRAPEQAGRSGEKTKAEPIVSKSPSANQLPVEIGEPVGNQLPGRVQPSADSMRAFRSIFGSSLSLYGKVVTKTDGP